MVLFGEVPGAATLAGTALIVLGTSMSARAATGPPVASVEP